jgi:hypothetical protein
MQDLASLSESRQTQNYSPTEAVGAKEEEKLPGLELHVIHSMKLDSSLG